MYRYKETAKAVWNMYSRDNNSHIGVNMEIWTPEMKLEKKSCQIMLKENIPGKKAISRLVTIEDGEIIEKPDDVQLLGTLTSEGFVVTGLQIIKDDENKV